MHANLKEHVCNWTLGKFALNFELTQGKVTNLFLNNRQQSFTCKMGEIKYLC